jgi:hypothetical protein
VAKRLVRTQYLFEIECVVDHLKTMSLVLNHTPSVFLLVVAGVWHQNEPADGLAPRPDSPRSGQFAPVGRMVHACAEQIRVPSFVLWLLARFAELARKSVV